jgi:hypothetical protein
MLDQKMGLELGARNSFVKAARGGNADAQNMLGWYWANGLGHLPKDTIQACNWYATAANQGHSDAINNLGACYEYPGFVQQDTNRAINLYALAASKGNVKAHENLMRLEASTHTLQTAYDNCVHLFAATECTELQQRLRMATQPQGPTHDAIAAMTPTKSSAPPKQEARVMTQTQVPAAPPRSIIPDTPQQSSRVEGRSVDWVGLATLALNIFAAAKGYNTAPGPVFIAPRPVHAAPPPASAVSVHCTSTSLGGTVMTNCN